MRLEYETCGGIVSWNSITVITSGKEPEESPMN